MIRRGALLWPLMLVLVACGHEESPTIETIRYTIDADRITVSGLSAGAYMAGQLHVAHSSLFRGAGLIAGGPYYCAEGSLQKGIGACVKGGDIELDRLVAYANEMVAAGKIDDTANLGIVLRSNVRVLAALEILGHGSSGCVLVVHRRTHI